jgi:hypothetical protein
MRQGVPLEAAQSHNSEARGRISPLLLSSTSPTSHSWGFAGRSVSRIFLPIADEIESGSYLLYDAACGTAAC